ncbi:MAG TPA: XdhC/CoxI family protein, partial [Desulfuromonadaceae bacterium]
MKDLALYEEIIRLTRAGEPFVLATVTGNNGSSPRKAGAKMLVRGDGTMLGSVGGGRVELETLRAALTALDEGEPCTLSFVLTEEHGFACGGAMTVYVEPHGSAPHLVMFGAGHVGRAVAGLAKRCGFRVTVVDERPECTGREELPFADEIVCSPVTEAFGRLRLNSGSYVVIATPGHVHDFDAVRGALATPAGFIGLLGSRRKRQALMRTLEEEGFTEEQRERIVTPVGLEIGAETPDEIAVSIMGQLVRERRDHEAS